MQGLKLPEIPWIAELEASTKEAQLPMGLMELWITVSQLSYSNIGNHQHLLLLSKLKASLFFHPSNYLPGPSTDRTSESKLKGILEMQLEDSCNCSEWSMKG